MSSLLGECLLKFEFVQNKNKIEKSRQSFIVDKDWTLKIVDKDKTVNILFVNIVL